MMQVRARLRTSGSLLATLFLFSAVLIILSGCDGPRDQAMDPAGQPEDVPASSTFEEATTEADTAFVYLPAPDFERTTISGVPSRLSNHRGKVVVVNFWATWCPPCRIETPDFVDLQEELRDEGLLFLGVSLDEEGFDIVRPFAREFGINYPLVLGDQLLVEQFGGIAGLPTTFVIDRQGRIRQRLVGLADRDRLEPLLRKLLAEEI